MFRIPINENTSQKTYKLGSPETTDADLRDLAMELLKGGTPQVELVGCGPDKFREIVKMLNAAGIGVMDVSFVRTSTPTTENPPPRELRPKAGERPRTRERTTTKTAVFVALPVLLA